MGFQELDLGKDLDDMAMATDRRPLQEQIKEFMTKYIMGRNWSDASTGEENLEKTFDEPLT